MASFLAILSLVVIVLFVIGIFSPKVSLFWLKDKAKQTRLRSIAIYFVSFFVLMILIGIFADTPKQEKISNTSDATESVQSTASKTQDETATDNHEQSAGAENKVSVSVDSDEQNQQQEDISLTNVASTESQESTTDESKQESLEQQNQEKVGTVKVEEISSDKPSTKQQKIEVNVKASPRNLDNVKNAIFDIETNLPAGTKLMLTLESPKNQYAEDVVIDENGKAVAEFTERDDKCFKGQYSLELTMVMAALQSEEVQAVIGKNGENMYGKYIENSGDSDDVDNTVSAKFTFNFKSNQKEIKKKEPTPPKVLVKTCNSSGEQWDQGHQCWRLATFYYNNDDLKKSVKFHKKACSLGYSSSCDQIKIWRENMDNFKQYE